MRIERRIYFEAKDGDIAPYASLPIAQLLSMRSESAAAEQAIFDSLKEQAAAWEEQAGKTLLLDKALAYVRTPHVQHTANEWQKHEYDRYTRSNRVYQMNYYIYENTRYDKEAQKSIPYSWTLTWSVRTNSPSRTQAKIAGQDRKVDVYKRQDEYRVNADEIEHDPYVLISILSAWHEGVFTLDEAQSTLEMLFEKQYILTVEEEVQVRYRTETRTDSEGNEYEVEVPYNYYILHVDLENFNLSHVPVYIKGEEQLSMYAMYMSSLGNRPDLFPQSG